MELEEISERHEAAFLEMISDYERNDPETYKRLYKHKSAWSSAEFQKFLKECRKQRLDWKPGPGKVSVTRYIMKGSEGQILANALMRFPLDPQTETDGGNLEVDVPPTGRGQNQGSMALALLLFEAVRAGMRRVLVTCLADDPIANRIILKNRGVFEDEVESQSTHPQRRGKKISRYWIQFS